MKSFKVTGKLTFADGAINDTQYGIADKQTLSIAEISFDMQVDRQQTRVEDLGGSLEAGDTYILFAALRLGFKSKKMSLGAFLAHLMGTAAAPTGDYTPITMAAAAAKNRVGAAKLQLFHPILGVSVPAIKTPDDNVILYQALAPDASLTSGAESEGEFSFMMDVPGSQTLHIHNQMLNAIADIT